MAIKFNKQKIEGVYVIEPACFPDQRGELKKTFCEDEFKEINFDKRIVRAIQSLTLKKGSIRGMHFQYQPVSEVKIVECIKGSIFDVAIDLRKDSPTFLQWHGEILSENNGKILFIPEGFAHGFQTLEDNCKVSYLVTQPYVPEKEGGIRYDDPLINVKWPEEVTVVSERDLKHPALDERFNGVSL